MVVVSRTLGPLHLEDLEPHRFEDLIRQLLYDFRQWQALESTGRSGSDDGFDARGWEVVVSKRDDQLSALVDDGDLGADTKLPYDGQQWLIQCKREKAIGPSKIETYLRGLPLVTDEAIHGLVFVGACDFSKVSRDRYYDVARKLGFAEAILWGKGEIEDQLFQPKNDHLLFAYFGVSLQIRRRSLRTAVRNRLSVKRKAKAALLPYINVLIRSASDERYPYLDGDISKARRARGDWEVLQVVGCRSDGVHLSHKRHFAMIGENGEWDYAEHMNDGPVYHDNPWFTAAEQDELDTINLNRNAAMAIWDGLPDQDKAWFSCDLVLPYDNIIDIDNEGDEFFGNPHVFADWINEKTGPFLEFLAVKLETLSQWSPRKTSGNDEDRIRIFSRSLLRKEK